MSLRSLAILIFLIAAVAYGLSLAVLWFLYRGPWWAVGVAVFRASEWQPGAQGLRRVALVAGAVALSSGLIAYALQQLGVP